MIDYYYLRFTHDESEAQKVPEFTLTCLNRASEMQRWDLKPEPSGSGACALCHCVRITSLRSQPVQESAGEE